MIQYAVIRCRGINNDNNHRSSSNRSVRDVARLPRLPHLQVLAALARPTHPGLHAQELRFRVGLPGLLAGHGHHHLRHRHVLRRKERRWHQFHLHSGRVLVHHCHNDHTRVSHLPTILPTILTNGRHWCRLNVQVTARLYKVVKHFWYLHLLWQGSNWKWKQTGKKQTKEEVVGCKGLETCREYWKVANDNNWANKRTRQRDGRGKRDTFKLAQDLITKKNTKCLRVFAFGLCWAFVYWNLFRKRHPVHSVQQ